MTAANPGRSFAVCLAPVSLFVDRGDVGRSDLLQLGEKAGSCIRIEGFALPLGVDRERDALVGGSAGIVGVIGKPPSISRT